jgi:conjugal transfer/entry exclusion protein
MAVAPDRRNGPIVERREEERPMRMLAWLMLVTLVLVILVMVLGHRSGKGDRVLDPNLRQDQTR